MAYGAKTTWIVVGDDRRARILSYIGPAEGLRLIEELHADRLPPPEDRPGRVHESAASARHAVGTGQDPNIKTDRAFLAHLAERVNHAAVTGGFDRLVLVAPPDALGELRGLLSENAARMISGTLDKDLTHARADQLPDHLGAVMNI